MSGNGRYSDHYRSRPPGPTRTSAPPGHRRRGLRQPRGGHRRARHRHRGGLRPGPPRRRGQQHRRPAVRAGHRAAQRRAGRARAVARLGGMTRP
ncbi:MAG: hypothetical protein EKK42_28775 [Pseudonocardiaceae bacterium]|nr:MAG: hypothetical protein EKK42_28775 [Pseudonocardiaceae bacterium]